MKFTTLACALLGAAAATELDLAADIQAQSEETQKDIEDDGDDAHLSQLITSALAGAPPGEITEPVGKASDKENDKQVTKGKTPNYSFHW